jgi:hypothetical protein
MCAASTLAPGAVFAVADSDALGLDTQHGAVVAATADSVKGAEGTHAAVSGMESPRSLISMRLPHTSCR